ncbi:MAG: oxidoreductase [Candidatus Binatia bacterium]|nr:MAG: oxidoreductase [Candidatus Binatia bacterium]
MPAVTDAFELAFRPGRIGSVELRNRILKSATFEGMSPGGTVTRELVEHHRSVAAGGAALTTVAYCAVSRDARTFEDQLWIRPEVVPALRELTEAVHAEGAKASLQLAHAGFFTQVAENRGRGALGPSPTLNVYGLGHGKAFAKGMTPEEIGRVVSDFGEAARLAVDAGFDAVELHLGHGYLLSQFLSPATNKRSDEWGGSLENRLRLPLDVVREVRRRTGTSVALLAKINLRDGFRGGLELEESIEVARALERTGVDALVLSGGFTSRNAFYLLRGDAPVSAMARAAKSRVHGTVLRLFGRFLVRSYPFEELFFLPEARRIRESVGLPLALLGGVVSRRGLATAMREGFDFVAMARALIADPDLPLRMRRGEVERSRCTHCNLCVVEMERGGVRCVLGTTS